MPSTAQVPSPISWSLATGLIEHSLATLARQGPSRHWYRRVAIAARDLEHSASAVGLILNPGAGSKARTAWLVAPRFAITVNPNVAAGHQVRFPTGRDARVVRASDAGAGLRVLELEGDMPAPAWTSRRPAAAAEVAVIGWGPALSLALARWSPGGGGTIESGDSLAAFGGAPLVSLSLGEVVAVLGAQGQTIGADALTVALAGAGAPAASARPKEDADDAWLERRPDPSDYDDRVGYVRNFIGVEVPLPEPRDDLANDVLEFEDTQGRKQTELRYTHFSLKMSRSRRMSMFTAVNIQGDELQQLQRGGERWLLDPRIADDQQFDNDLYVRNDLDRGHMVRRLDPVWGDDAVQANGDTFHYTNSCPQHKDLNQKIWNDLEEYIYQNSANHQLRVNVFTGPVFGDDDPLYRDARIPLQFWKVVSMVRDDGALSATAYILSQADMVEGLEFAFGEFRTYQLPIVDLEKLTRLDFGALREHDPKKPSADGLESVRMAYTPIHGPRDLQL